MIARFYLTYAALALAMALSVYSAFRAGDAPSAEAWISILSLTLVIVCIAIRTCWKAPERTRFVRWHERAQDRLLLLFACVGVISAYQWLFFFGHLALSLRLNDVLQAVSWVFQAGAVAQLTWGLVNLLIGRPKNT